jgi:hypothetical protein
MVWCDVADDGLHTCLAHVLLSWWSWSFVSIPPEHAPQMRHGCKAEEWLKVLDFDVAECLGQ